MRRSAGFTLIEMTVSLALLGFIAVLMFESLRYGQRSYESATRRGAAAWQIFASQRLIRSLIETAYPQQSDTTLAIPEHGLAGGVDRMSMIAGAPMAIGGAGLYRYEIALRPNRTGSSDLVMRWRAQLNGGTQQALTDVEEVLVERVVGLRFGYQNGSQWSEYWTAPALPRLVRMKVTFAPGDVRRWPEMIAAPRITDDANCVFDIIARRCRERGA